MTPTTAYRWPKSVCDWWPGDPKYQCSVAFRESKLSGTNQLVPIIVMIHTWCLRLRYSIYVWTSLHANKVKYNTWENFQNFSMNFHKLSKYGSDVCMHLCRTFWLAGFTKNGICYWLLQFYKNKRPKRSEHQQSEIFDFIISGGQVAN